MHQDPLWKKEQQAKYRSTTSKARAAVSGRRVRLAGRDVAAPPGYGTAAAIDDEIEQLTGSSWLAALQRGEAA